MAKHCASMCLNMCEVYSVMLTCSRTILLVSPQYASKWWCRHAIVLASACCHGCMRIYTYAYAQTTISNMNISCLNSVLLIPTLAKHCARFCLKMLRSIFSHPDLFSDNLACFRPIRWHMHSDVGMLSWSRAHAVMVACAYKHMRIRKETSELQYKKVLP